MAEKKKDILAEQVDDYQVYESSPNMLNQAGLAAYQQGSTSGMIANLATRFGDSDHAVATRHGINIRKELAKQGKLGGLSGTDVEPLIPPDLGGFPLSRHPIYDPKPTKKKKKAKKPKNNNKKKKYSNPPWKPKGNLN
jgi:hypothetical protein